MLRAGDIGRRFDHVLATAAAAAYDKLAVNLPEGLLDLGDNVTVNLDAPPTPGSTWWTTK